MTAELNQLAAELNAGAVREQQQEIVRLRRYLDQARTALLHGTPEQRFNMASIITREALDK